ncbi:hypothetical protein HYC85_029808 [Camellia sinensis]|uniref:Uncharacterized protein n=1 Tax=Camellia sinensis TaxID=4442 RepID=A0A7J7FZM2_CAMSI|nr:hypothetical protein HYC85_029808 [Camellia sinensis]
MYVHINAQLFGLLVFCCSLPQAPVMYVLYRKACGNLGLLAGYDANLLGAGLGRDRISI